MHYLGLALYAEGPTDYYFLQPLLRRLCDDLCRAGATQEVELGIELRRHEIESIGDPKALLASIFEASGPTRRSRRQGVSPFLDPLGERVRIDRLRELPSFAELERRLSDVLRSLGITGRTA